MSVKLQGLSTSSGESVACNEEALVMGHTSSLTLASLLVTVLQSQEQGHLHVSSQSTSCARRQMLSVCRGLSQTAKREWPECS